MKFTVHHTCLKNGGHEYCEKNAPFLSEFTDDNRPFLGSGFYFWEYNEDYAKYWGKQHYRNDFFVLEAVVNVNHEEEGFYLDLAGNREHMVNFVNLLKTFNLIHEEGTEGIDLSYIIQYLRDLAEKEEDDEIFPFKVIRALDYKNNDNFGIKIDFNQITSSFTMLNPRIILAYQNKRDISFLTNPFIKFAS